MSEASAIPLQQASLSFMVQTMVLEIAHGLEMTRTLSIDVGTVIRAEHAKGFEHGRELRRNRDSTYLILAHLA